MTVPDRSVDTTDADLLAAVAAGGDGRPRAWATLVARHSPRMYAVARSFALDPATAEDLVQTAWLRLLERVGQLRDANALASWLCMIVRNEARRTITRRREIPTVLGLENQAGTDEEPGARLSADERAVAVRLAFSRLGPECQQLLRLVVADPPLSYDEIAVTLQRPRGSLGPTRRRCLDGLRRHLPAGFEL